MSTNYRKSLHVAFFAILIIASGCELLSPVAEPECATCEQAFEIHLNNNFDNDRVHVEIDGKVIFDERITTDYVWSLAEIVKLKRPMGTHHIKIVVNGSEEEKRTFELDRLLFIHVRYYPEAIPDLSIPRGVVIEVSEIRPMYD